MRVCSPVTRRCLKNNFTNCNFGVRNISAAQLVHARVLRAQQCARECVRVCVLGVGVGGVVLKGLMPPQQTQTGTNRIVVMGQSL